MDNYIYIHIIYIYSYIFIGVGGVNPKSISQESDHRPTYPAAPVWT